jgi:hypothetical protein
MNAESLPILFRALELSAFAREAESALARAEAENWGYRRLLQHLAEAEVQDRRARKIERLLKYSGLPPSETFARFDETKMPEKARRMLPTLRSGDFVRRGDNLVAIGLPGRGKTGFCAALGRELLERHELKVLFVPAFKLAARLLAAKRDLKLASDHPDAALPQVGAVSERNCSHCHRRMLLTIAAVAFVPRSAAATGRARRAGPSTRGTGPASASASKAAAAFNGVLVPGQPLPAFGTCKHYVHSYR